MTDKQREKLSELEAYIKGLGSLAVGFSGGVDSAFLLFTAHKVLGEKAIAVTNCDAALPGRELDEAKAFCNSYGIKQVITSADPMQESEYRTNSPDRCYHCKKRTFSEIINVAKEHGIQHIAEGSNVDDLGDYRPGLRAADELGVLSPLRTAGLTKEDIRSISRDMGLPTWNKPSYACLASRFVYGEEITEEKLHMIDLAEQFLIEQGFCEERVRLHGNIARIEVPEADIARLAQADIRTTVYERFKEIGFLFVTLDMHGYTTGSMNVTLS